MHAGIYVRSSGRKGPQLSGDPCYLVPGILEGCFILQYWANRVSPLVPMHQLTGA